VHVRGGWVSRIALRLKSQRPWSHRGFVSELQKIQSALRRGSGGVWSLHRLVFYDAC
jgi:hypothetical protein